MDHDDYVKLFNDIEFARAQRPKTARVLEAVLRIVDDGRAYLRAWSTLRDVFHREPSLADLALPFLTVTAVAHLEAAILHAAKLVDRQRQSISLNSLFSILEADDAGRPSIAADERLKGTIEAGRQRLRQIEIVVNRVKQRRDQHIAHLDQRVLLGSQDAQAVDAADLQLVFDTAEAIGVGLSLSRAELAQIERFSWADATEHAGPEGLDDFLYFTTAAFRDAAVPSPSPRVEKLREWDRIMRRIRAENAAIDGLAGGGGEKG